MKLNTIVLLSLLLVLFVCIFYIYQSFNNEKETQETPVTVENKVPILSVEQKIAQLLAVSIKLSDGKTDSLTNSQIEQLQPGFVVMYGSKLSANSVKETTNILKNFNIPLPITIAVDHEGGAVQRLSGEGFTKLQPWSELCQIDTETRRVLFQQSAKEIKDAGIDIVLGPVVDFSQNSSTIMQNRICSANEETLVKSTAEIIHIYEEAGITATLKHFPGIANLDVDLHYGYESIKDNSEQFAIFEKLLQRYPNIAVMTSHAGLENTNIPCSLDKQCVGLLSKYPEVLFITDDIKMISTYAEVPTQTLSDLVKQAILATNTIILLGPDVYFDEVKQIIHELSEEYKIDEHFAKTVDTSVIKIGKWKEKNQL